MSRPGFVMQWRKLMSLSKFNELTRIYRAGKESEALLISKLEDLAEHLLLDLRWNDTEPHWQEPGTAGHGRLTGDHFVIDKSGALTGVLKLALTKDDELNLRITARRTGGQGGSWSACIQDKEPMFDMLQPDDRRW
jgi:hypothetical protein